MPDGEWAASRGAPDAAGPSLQAVSRNPRPSAISPRRWAGGQRVKAARSERLLLGRECLEAMIEVDGAIPGQNLLQIGLEGTFALSQLLGPALLGRLAVFRG